MAQRISQLSRWRRGRLAVALTVTATAAVAAAITGLVLTALGSGSSWTSGRVQTASASVGAPAGGELDVTAAIQQPAGGGNGQANQRGRCPDLTARFQPACALANQAPSQDH